MKLSKAAQSALLAAQSRAGAKVAAPGSQMAHLKLEGLVSPNGNLTAKGEIERRKLARKLEDEAFG